MDLAIEAVLFDAGGTLVLQNPGLMGRILEVDLDEQSCFEAHYLAMDAYSRRRAQGDHSRGWDWWLEHYFTTLEVPRPAEAGRRIDYGHGIWNLPITGVGEGVAKLAARGLRCAVISNSDGSIRASLDEAGLGHLFEFVIDSSEVGCHKPDAEIFALGVEGLGDVSPRSIAFVGDSWYHDVQGALEAGYGQAWLVDPLGLYPRHSRRVRSVADLPGVLG